jgi:hypothetical protein
LRRRYATLGAVQRVRRWLASPSHAGAPALFATWALLVAAAAAADAEPAVTAPLFSVISLVVVATTFVLVIGCVLLHYEMLRFLSRLLLRFHRKRRRRILVLVLALLALAIVEIWLFGIGYYLLLADPAYGRLHGPTRIDQFLDYVYFSAVIYTTLGLGDLVPSGSIRFLVGMQALVGFTLISWSAAFTFLEMERFWRDSTEERHRVAYGPDHDRGS